MVKESIHLCMSVEWSNCRSLAVWAQTSTHDSWPVHASAETIYTKDSLHEHQVWFQLFAWSTVWGVDGHICASTFFPAGSPNARSLPWDLLWMNASCTIMQPPLQKNQSWNKLLVFFSLGGHSCECFKGPYLDWWELLWVMLLLRLGSHSFSTSAGSSIQLQGQVLRMFLAMHVCFICNSWNCQPQPLFTICFICFHVFLAAWIYIGLCLYSWGHLPSDESFEGHWALLRTDHSKGDPQVLQGPLSVASGHCGRNELYTALES